MKKEQTNTYGDLAEILATLYFQDKGYEVYKPMSKNALEDLLVIKDNRIEKVQCKYCAYKYKDQYEIKFRRKIKDGYSAYTKESFNYLFIKTPEDTYSIPSSEIFKNSGIISNFRLSQKWEKYKIS